MTTKAPHKVSNAREAEKVSQQVPVNRTPWHVWPCERDDLPRHDPRLPGDEAGLCR